MARMTKINETKRSQVFRSMYPRCWRVGIRPVSTDNNEYYKGFDIDDVKAALGTTRFNLLMTTVKEVFCCGHRTWPLDHAERHKRGAEVHCIWSRDLEAFLKVQSRRLSSADEDAHKEEDHRRD